MANLLELVKYTAQKLEHGIFCDNSVNGLQVQGSAEVTKIAAAVDGAFETAKMAKDCGANLLLVHHGILWGKDLPVVGAHRELLKFLIENELSLVASHLPLDAHQELGNNFLLAKYLGLGELQQFLPYDGQLIGCLGKNTSKDSVTTLRDKLKNLQGATPNFTCLEFGPKVPEKIGVCSGSAVDAIQRFQLDGFDTFITGEPKQFAYHFAKENRLNVICAGHYATETLGVKALAEHLAAKFNIDWEFIDHPTGI